MHVATQAVELGHDDRRSAVVVIFDTLRGFERRRELRPSCQLVALANPCGPRAAVLAITIPLPFVTASFTSSLPFATARQPFPLPFVTVSCAAVPVPCRRAGLAVRSATRPSRSRGRRCAVIRGCGPFTCQDQRTFMVMVTS